MNFILSTDLFCDLTPSTLTANGIHFLSGVTLSGEEILSEPETTEDFDEIYACIKGGEDIRRSELTVADYEQYFDNLFEKNRGDIVHICSSETDYLKAYKASKNEAIKFPRRSVYIVKNDSLSAGTRLALNFADELRRKDFSAEEVFVALNELCPKIKTFIAVKDENKLLESGLLLKAVDAKAVDATSLFLLEASESNGEKPFGRAKLLGRSKGEKTAVKKIVEALLCVGEKESKVYLSASSETLSVSLYDELIKKGFTVDFSQASVSTVCTLGATCTVIAVVVK